MTTLVVFSHGKESGPWGSKIQRLAKLAQAHGAQVESIDYRQTPDEVSSASNENESRRRVARLLATNLPPHERLILVGSSMGGYVSTVASAMLKPDGLFLLAPAFYLPGYVEQDPVPHARHTAMVHGWRDEVVAPENAIRFAQKHRCLLHLVDGDHRLTDALPLVERLFADYLTSVLDTVERSG